MVLMMLKGRNAEGVVHCLTKALGKYPGSELLVSPLHFWASSQGIPSLPQNMAVIGVFCRLDLPLVPLLASS